MTAPEWLADPALARLWAATRDRLERSHLTPHGRITLDDLSRDERHAIGGLIGRAIVADRVAVDLADLDAVVGRRSPYRGLAEAIESVTGARLRDRRAERSAAAAAREAPLALARELMQAEPALAPAAWTEAWLAGVRRSGLLARRAVRADDAVRWAVATLARLLGPLRSPVSRADLAAGLTGDAHGLDDGTVLAQLVLRAIALDAGVELPDNASARRRLWERYGVSTDSVSTTCLAVGLRAGGASSVARRLALAADSGDPVHLTVRDLRRLDLVSPGTVLVCENPRVLEAVADRFAGSVPVVCTAGQPALVVVDVLQRLVAAGASLRYHGDFDWPGLAIANRLVAEVGVVPWSMGASNYSAAVRRFPTTLALTGRPVDAAWDNALRSTMTGHGVAVHEEAVLDELLDGVAGW